MKKFLIFFIFFFFFYIENVFSTPGCLVGSTFYTTYLGLMDHYSTTNVPTYALDGSTNEISYNGDVCDKITAPGGNIKRDGPQCWTVLTANYRRTTTTYPPGTGTEQNFTPYIDMTCPIDDYVPLLLIISIALGLYYVRKRNLPIC